MRSAEVIEAAAMARVALVDLRQGLRVLRGACMARGAVDRALEAGTLVLEAFDLTALIDDVEALVMRAERMVGNAKR